MLKFHPYNFLLLIILLSNAPSYGQVSKKTSNPTLKESFEELKGIFKKKGTDNSQSIEKNENQSISRSRNQIVGDKLAADVVYIEADRLCDFNKGKAIIQKGTATAMIDAKGNIVVPFNRYRFFALDNTYSFFNDNVSANGIFQFAPNEKEGFTHFMNAGGKELTGPTVENSSSLSFDESKSILIKTKTLYNRPRNAQGHHPTLFYYMTSDGQVYQHEKQLGYIREGIGIYSAYSGNTWKSGYARLNGESITEAVYDEARPFSNGMALVGQRDQFGQIKYGYINSDGKLIIPCMFSKRPSDFWCGYAKVEPKDKSEFEYGYINKAGKLIFTITMADRKKYGLNNVTFGDFQDYGMMSSIGGFYVMDTTFRIIPKADFFARYGIAGVAHFKGAYYDRGNGKRHTGKGLFSVIGESNPKIYFSINPSAHIGFINLATGQVVMPAFSRLGYFDPVSHLAYAEIDNIVEKSGHKIIETKKGYINEQGEWIVLQSKGSTW
ncbi:WG repeat-containing protein [Olivibacter jilunii]|uniref:WG repeat-containing protein n=1 Tax=Olivibacter jilunii TaxID=985016 RepID=UPI00103156F2|nr:WG repeat-containing protein [Olivibacter jilunii]